MSQDNVGCFGEYTVSTFQNQGFVHPPQDENHLHLHNVIWGQIPKLPCTQIAPLSWQQFRIQCEWQVFYPWGSDNAEAIMCTQQYTGKLWMTKRSDDCAHSYQYNSYLSAIVNVLTSSTNQVRMAKFVGYWKFRHTRAHQYLAAWYSSATSCLVLFFSNRIQNKVFFLLDRQ